MSKVYEKLHQNVESNIEQGVKHTFKIKDTSKIVNLLRNSLYQHKERTVVQEYISNARDAIREKYKNELIKKDPSLDPKKYKGNDKAVIELKLRSEINKLIKSEDIKVSVPTNLNPFFKVRDYGVGLSPERIADVFTYYCESTKGDSEIETGGFGIGAKSAWAYTDHFVVVSFYNGKKYTYTSHTETYEGELSLDDVSDTTEPNGVEVIVAVNPDDIPTFTKAILRVCYFWETRPLITGLTQSDLPEWFDMKPDLSFGKWRVFVNEWANHVNEARVFQEQTVQFIFVLDGIPYTDALPLNLAEELQPMLTSRKNIGKYSVFAYIADLGSADVVASRESLEKTPKTLALLKGLRIQKELAAHYLEVDDNIKTFEERIASYRRFYDLLGYEMLNKITPKKEYNLKKLSYKIESYSANPTITLKAKDNTDFYFLPVEIKTNITDTESVSIKNRTRSHELKIHTDGTTPVLIQDEELSVSNRRLKMLEFFKEKSKRNFLFIAYEEKINKKEALDCHKDLNCQITSAYEVKEKERAQINRASGVYTLQKLNISYSRPTKTKFQERFSYFDSLEKPIILLTEEELKSLAGYNNPNKNFARDLQNIGGEFYTAADTTIKKLTGKKNILLFSEIKENIQTHFTLSSSAIQFYISQIFASEINFYSNCGILSNLSDSELKEIKDTELVDAFLDLRNLYNSKGSNYGYNIPSLDFATRYFPEEIAKIKAKRYDKNIMILSRKLMKYPLAQHVRDVKMKQEIIFYINAKNK